MDPDSTLQGMRDSIELWMNNPESAAGQEAAGWAAEAADALDQWLSRGGFLPDAWKGAGK